MKGPKTGFLNLSDRLLASFNTDLGEGDLVTQGEKLGVMGSTGCSTGPHIHFSVDRSENWPITWINQLKADPFGWLADHFPDSTYGESGDPDPWQEYNQNLTTPRNATSDYLWIEELGQPVLSQPDTPTTIMSVDNEVMATFPIDAVGTAFRAEMWPTLNSPDLPNGEGAVTHGFALYAYVPGDILIWEVQTPVEIAVSAENPGSIGISDAYHAYRWDAATNSWIEIQTTYNTISGEIMFNTDRLGRFVVTSEMEYIYLPTILNK